MAQSLLSTAAEVMRRSGGATGLFSPKTTGTGGLNLHRSPSPIVQRVSHPSKPFSCISACVSAPTVSTSPRLFPRRAQAPAEPYPRTLGDQCRGDPRTYEKTDPGSSAGSYRAQGTCLCVMLHPSFPHTSSAISAQARRDHVPQHSICHRRRK